MAGGRITSGVVRVGDTVRRPPSAASGFVAGFLPALARRSFTGCPRHLGFDDQGREVLSYVPGEIAPRWRRFDDEQVVAVGQLLRRLHDASRDLVPTAVGYSREFASGYRGPDAVICHHDAGPNNVILHSGQPVAVIDFDFAAPGHPMEDLAYATWAWCLASKPERQPVTDQARQVALLATAYGLSPPERDALPEAIVARQRRNLAYWRRHRDRVSLNGPPVAEVIGWNRRELAYTRANLAALHHALSTVEGRHRVCAFATARESAAS
jgi:Ser/Thr protein kinase RdoA (MazF antagonist)